MGIITVSELKPDMVLGDDLRALNGRFLLSKGTKLTDKHLRVIKVWGVIEANIQGVSQEDIEAKQPADLDPAVLAAAEELTRIRFAHADLQQPAVRELFRLCVRRKAERTDRRSEQHGEKPKPGLPQQETTPERAPTRGDAPSKVSQVIQGDIALSTLPVILTQINEAIKKPNSSAKDIARVISRDTSLSARLLTVVNSALFGYPSRIDSLSRAVLIVGIKQLSSLAMGIKVISFFRSIPSSLIDMKSFVEHSVATGIIARSLASYKNIQNIERLFVGGLLHDIGRLVLYNNTPEDAKSALLAARHQHTLLCSAEKELMHCDHARIGGHLLKKWKLPVSLENIVTYHHHPLHSRDPLEPSIVHFSDMMANALGLGSSGERYVPPLDPAAWECMELSPNILTQVMKQVDVQYEETLRFLVADD